MENISDMEVDQENIDADEGNARVIFMNRDYPLEANEEVVEVTLDNSHNIEAEDSASSARTSRTNTPPESAISSRTATPSVEYEATHDSESEDVTQESAPKCPRLEKSDADDDEGQLCPICFDNWSNTGEHRLCALKCGHLFGFKCLNRWLESQTKKFCPTCKKKVNRGDIRNIYAKKLIAVDTTELEHCKKQLEYAIEEKNQIQLELTKSVCHVHALNQEINQLKKQVSELSKSASRYPSSSQGFSQRTSSNSLTLFRDKSLEICKNNGCRVLDANCQLDLIMASMKSPNSLFNGFGLRKLNISNYKALGFLPLHSDTIRDVVFHPQNHWVLTASTDKSFKIVDCATNQVVSGTTQQVPLWSCCWDISNPYVCYVGSQLGSVSKYDTRNLSEPAHTIPVQGNITPVISVASVPTCTQDFPNGGIIACKLNSMWFFESTPNDYTKHLLTVDGPFFSMKFQQSSQMFLVSSRPNLRTNYSRHTLGSLYKKDDKVDCNIVHEFHGSGMQKFLSRTCFLTNERDYVAAHQESDKRVNIWSINNGEKVCSVPAHEPVLDLCGIENQNGNFLVTLTSRKMDFFKFA